MPANLTPSAFERLLKTLDSDRDRAALAYERLRDRVEGLLRWWGAAHAADLADETIDRVAANLERGASVSAQSFGAYVRGVARLVFYESQRRDARERPIAEDVAAPELEAGDEQKLVCLDGCLANLDPSDRKLVLGYYDLGREVKAEARRRLASKLGISPLALRVRAFRIRERLEACVLDCLKQNNIRRHPSVGVKH